MSRDHSQDDPLVEQWFDLFMRVTPETPFEALVKASNSLWRLYQEAEMSSPGQILKKLNAMSKPARRRRASGKEFNHVK
jgi:hypothetical protein